MHKLGRPAFARAWLRRVFLTERSSSGLWSGKGRGLGESKGVIDGFGFGFAIAFDLQPSTSSGRHTMPGAGPIPKVGKGGSLEIMFFYCSSTVFWGAWVMGLNLDLSGEAL